MRALIARWLPVLTASLLISCGSGEPVARQQNQAGQPSKALLNAEVSQFSGFYWGTRETEVRRKLGRPIEEKDRRNGGSLITYVGEAVLNWPTRRSFFFDRLGGLELGVLEILLREQDHRYGACEEAFRAVRDLIAERYPSLVHERAESEQSLRPMGCPVQWAAGWMDSTINAGILLQFTDRGTLAVLYSVEDLDAISEEDTSALEEQLQREEAIKRESARSQF